MMHLGQVKVDTKNFKLNFAKTNKLTVPRYVYTVNNQEPVLQLEK